MVSASQEDYLSTIYRLEAETGRATTSRIADALSISQASVTSFLKRAADDGLVEHRERRGARLTEDGRREALKVIRRHRVVERFLVDVLGLPWDRVDDEAHRLEHAVSDDVVERMERLVEDPKHCPHGYPIPDASLTVDDEEGRVLAELPAGATAEIVRLDEDPELLRYADELGLHPGTEIEVTDKDAYDGPIRLVVDDAERTVGRKAAQRIVAREVRS